MFEHQKIARECQIRDSIVIGNGQMIRLAPGPLAVVDEVHASRLVLDGNEILPVDGAVVKERKRLLFNGSVVATVVVDRKGRLRADPRITLQGLVEADGAEDLYDAAVEAVESALERLPPGAREDDISIEEAAVRALRKIVQQLRGKKPATAVHVVRV
jgi:ribonuclease J